MDAATLTPGHRQFLAARAGRVDRLRAWLSERAWTATRLTLELGCGHGHFLTAYAQAHPEAQCIGIDLVTKRIEKARAKRDKRGLSNLDFIKADVREFLEALPQGIQLERVFVLFPDPWPKKRHTKNRILQAALLDALATRMEPGGCLHFRTDHADTFAWGMAVIAGHADWEIRDDAEWPFEAPSYFQELLGDYQSLTAERL